MCAREAQEFQEIGLPHSVGHRSPVEDDEVLPLCVVFLEGAQIVECDLGEMTLEKRAEVASRSDRIPTVQDAHREVFVGQERAANDRRTIPAKSIASDEFLQGTTRIEDFSSISAGARQEPIAGLVRNAQRMTIGLEQRRARPHGTWKATDSACTNTVPRRQSSNEGSGDVHLPAACRLLGNASRIPSQGRTGRPVDRVDVQPRAILHRR